MHGACDVSMQMDYLPTFDLNRVLTSHCASRLLLDVQHTLKEKQIGGPLLCIKRQPLSVKIYHVSLKPKNEIP